MDDLYCTFSTRPRQELDTMLADCSVSYSYMNILVAKN